MTDRELRLITAGWKQLPSGRWAHPSMPPVMGRHRAFNLNDALTLLDASNAAALPTASAVLVSDDEALD